MIRQRDVLLVHVLRGILAISFIISASSFSTIRIHASANILTGNAADGRVERKMEKETCWYLTYALSHREYPEGHKRVGGRG
jgi:hypothetical protein